MNKLTSEEKIVFWSVQLGCAACGHSWNELIKKELRGHSFDCERCGEIESASEQITPPNMMGVGTKNGMDSGAYPDGMRAKSDAWVRAKEAAKLEVEAVKLHHSKRGELNKEISKIKGK